MFTLTHAYILGSVVGVGALSLSGIILFTLREQWLAKLMLALISFSTGAMLGDVFLHMLPDMIEDETFAQLKWFMVLGGMLFSFVLEKFIHWHHCHDSSHHHHPVGIMNIVGDFIHNALDGILIASGFLVDINVGIATTVAVLFHEIPQEISDIGLLLYSGYSRKSAILLNALTGMAAVIGAVLVILFSSQTPQIASLLVPFAAGNLLYIAGSDLIPELHKETNGGRSIMQFAGILIGIAFMAAFALME